MLEPWSNCTSWLQISLRMLTTVIFFNLTIAPFYLRDSSLTIAQNLQGKNKDLFVRIRGNFKNLLIHSIFVYQCFILPLYVLKIYLRKVDRIRTCGNSWFKTKCLWPWVTTLNELKKIIHSLNFYLYQLSYCPNLVGKVVFKQTTISFQEIRSICKFDYSLLI